MSSTTLRVAGAADRAAIEALLRACELPLPGAGAPASLFLVAEDPEGGLIGCAGLEQYGTYGLLRSVAVAPEARGAGLGARLTGAIVTEARRRGLTSLYALTTTAERYFPRLGFAAMDRREIAPAVRESEEFATTCPATAIALRLDLDASTAEDDAAP